MNHRRMRAWFLCLVMVFSLVGLCACGKEAPKPTEDVQQTTDPTVASGEALYRVAVVDGVGKPYTEKIIVKILQGEEQIAMLKVNAEGVVEKALPRGDYRLEIMSTDSGKHYYYDTASAVLTSEKTQLELVLSQQMGEGFESVNAPSVSTGEQLPFNAYYVSTGTTHVTVNSSDRNYFLFVPSKPGAYEISASGDAAIGVYGASVHFITGSSTYEMVDGKINFSVQSSMIGSGETGTTVFVLGLDVKDGVSDVLLNIVCTGEAEWSFTEQPWINYQPKNDITAFVLDDGVVLKQFDLTADGYELVLNPEDGCYHVGTADGPKVYVQLSEACYGISLMNMVGEIVYKDGVLMQTGTAPFRYSYDNGKEDFFKEDYTDAMREYVTARDKKTGVYPLNEDLYYMLPLGIQAMGWCRENTANFLFRDVDGVNLDIAWMFLLCYEDKEIPADPTDPSDPTTEPTEPSESEPTEPADCSHAYAVTSRKDATCVGKGSVEYTCSKCGDSYSQELPAVGHQFSDDKCSVCGAKNPEYTDKPTTIIHDNKDTPDEIGGILQFDATVQAGHLHYYNVYRVSGTYLTIAHKDAYVMYDGKVYEAKNGVVTVPGLQSEGMNSPVQLAIGNKGDKDATFKVVMAYPVGTQMNPHVLKIGKITTNVEEGNDQGVFYTYTATKSGVLTIRLDSVSSGAEAGVTMFNETTSQYVTLEENGNGSVSVAVAQGETVSIVIAALPDANYNYPAATIQTTATIS